MPARINWYFDRAKFFLNFALLTSICLLNGCHDNSGAGGGSAPPAAVAPSISSQPSDQSITAGQSAIFSVTATGTAPLSYQWQRDGVAIAGATSSAFTLSSAATTDSGAKFIVVVSNPAGSVTSNPGTLTVAAPGTLVSALTGGQVKSGDGRVTLTIPANALNADATVNISPSGTWTVPTELANEFSVITGTTYVILTQGGTFDASVKMKISFSTAGLAIPQTVRKLAARPQDSGSNSGPDNLGLSEDCGDGDPAIVILAPGDGYDPGTYISGCPGTPGGSGSGNQSTTTVSLSTWTPPTQSQVPSNNNIWENFTSRTEGTIGYQVNGNYYGAATGGSTWMGPTQVSLSSNQVGWVNDPNFSQQTSLMTLVSSTGSTIAQQAMPITPADVVLDGPGNFYAMFGLLYTESAYIARYQLKVAKGSRTFTQIWERTFSGAPATADGTHADPLDHGITGVNFELDPNTGDLVALALPGYNGLTDDEKARLQFTADGFLLRFNRDGGLVWASALTPVKPYDSARAAWYTLRIDHQGSAYVAGACMLDGDCGDHTGSGLALQKVDAGGKLVWATSIASADEIGQIRSDGIYFPAAEIGIDKNNDAYLTYRRFSQPYDTDGGQSGRTNVVKVSGSTGVPTPLGPVDAAFDGAGGQLWNHYGSSYVDDGGNIYIFSFVVPGGYYVQLSMLDPTLKLLHSSNLLHFHPLNDGEAFPGTFEVDPSGNVFEQYAGRFQNASTPDVCGEASAGITCYGAYLRKFHF